ncbi:MULTISPECIES: RNase adapter RapZ [Vogesella]|uniref:RNase adapter RapZ n=1 Tax=Vogesella indigofera TaxID=45465 RepID=A0ABT5I7T6_VOGIN|nr:MULTISPECIES: RNase adapter RapZ [Vogesella]KMJ54131.1 nucleotide-binding protein [Vogesella sp. EB]MDC7692244.1 RNase adapter RapZ [Vogesella indigofera]MDC7708797.1 RNase adapter RapZ [Vogesella indigofera]
MQLILISGLSGSGKSVALRLLEDNGYYCVDNLPATMLTDVVALYSEQGYQHVAISVDTRSAPTLAALPEVMASLKAMRVDVRLIYLEATTEVLVQRFSETRRRHPLSGNGLTVEECIRLEREMLEHIHELGHRIDTSHLSANALRAWVKVLVDADADCLTLVFESFGFKHGLPLDADFVFDVRCLPNPYYEVALRPLTGQDEAICRFFEGEASVAQMLADIRQFLQNWLPRFRQDNRSYVTVAIGCTGGQHRSVYLAEQLAKAFAGEQVLLRHRQLPAKK